MLSARLARAGLRASTTQFSAPRTAALNGLRTYATPAQEAKPPVALFGVDGTYASALVCRLFPIQPHNHPTRHNQPPPTPTQFTPEKTD